MFFLYICFFSRHDIMKLTAKVSPLKLFFLLKPSFLLLLHNFTKILHDTLTHSKQHHIRSFHINTSHDPNSRIRILGFFFFFLFFSHARILSTLPLHMSQKKKKKNTSLIPRPYVFFCFFFT